MTDSGGLQKEAFFFKKFCLTLRDDTEWVELVEGGFNQLVGADYDAILKGCAAGINSTLDFSVNLYGNGDASDKIVKAIIQYKS